MEASVDHVRLGHGVLLLYWVEGGAEPAPESGSVTQVKAYHSNSYLYDTTMFWRWLIHPSLRPIKK